MGWLSVGATRLPRAFRRGVSWAAIWALLVAMQSVGAQLEPDGTGRAMVQGPRTWDTAFLVDVPGLSGGFSPPVVLGREIFVLTEYRFDPATFEEVEPALWRISTETAEVTKFLEFAAPDRFASGLATDGAHLIIARARSIEARSPASGEVAWATPIPAIPEHEIVMTSCAVPQMLDAVVFVGCTTAQMPRGPQSQVAPPQPMPEFDVVMALDAATGDLLWSRFRDTEALTGEESTRGITVGGPTRGAVGVPTGIHDIVVADGILVAAIVDRNPQPAFAQCAGAGTSTSPPPLFQTVWALDPSTGAHLWQWGLPGPTDPPTGADAALTAAAQFDTYSRVAPGIMLDTDGVLVKGEHLHLLDAKSGCVGRTVRIGGDADTPLGSNLLAADRDTIVVARHVTVYGLDRKTLQQKWEYALSDDVPRPEQRAIVVGTDVLLLTRTSDVNVVSDAARLASLFDGRVTVLSLEDGSFRWSRDVRPFTFTSFMRSVGVGDGFVVVDGSDGPVMVIGDAPAGIRLSARLSTSTPEIGSVVRLDLSASRPGVFGTSFEVRVDWGDGNATEWSEGRVFEHAFGVRGLRNVTVASRNDAGQTSTVVVPVDVGWTQRQPSGFFETAFSRENQERTYFLLGLGVTFLLSVGGLIFPLNKAKAKIFGGSKEPKGPSSKPVRKRK